MFLASNGPSDVQARAQSWLRSPILGRIPVALLNFASGRPVIALTALFVGVAIGWKLALRPKVSEGVPWSTVLGNDMLLLAHQIEQAQWYHSLEGVNADLMMVAMRARRQGLAWPKREQGFVRLDQFLPYLHRVSALLRAGEVEEARNGASILSQKPQEEKQAF